MTQPKVILADEPTGNLDSETSVEVMTLFQDLWSTGITILLVTHEPDIAGFAGRVISMKDGRVRLDRTQQPEDARQALARAVAQREQEQAQEHAHEGPGADGRMTGAADDPHRRQGAGAQQAAVVPDRARASSSASPP